MWPFRPSARRLAVRADTAEAESLTRLPRTRTLPGILIAGVFFVAATLVIYYPAHTHHFAAGQIAPHTLRSPLALTVSDSAQADHVRASSPSVLVPDAQGQAQVESQLTSLLEDVRGVTRVQDLPPAVLARWPKMTPRALDILQRTSPRSYDVQISALLASLANAPLVTPKTVAQIRGRSTETVYVSTNGPLDGGRGLLTSSNVIPLNTDDPARIATLQRAVGEAMPQELAPVITAYLLSLQHPLYDYDPKLTAELAQQSVATVPQVHIAPGQTLVEKGQPITPQVVSWLEKAQQRYGQKLAQDFPWASALAHLGAAAVVALLTSIGAIYVATMSPVRNTLGRAWALAGLLLLMLILAKAGAAAMGGSVVYALGVAPTLLATVILVIAFNQRFALVVSALHGLLVTVALDQSLEFYLTILAGIAVLSFALKEIRTRGKLIQVGLLTGLVLMLSVWALGVMHLSSAAWDPNAIALSDMDSVLSTVGINGLWALVAGVGVGALTLSLLPAIERVFRITTAVSLLELCDLSRPLLKRLATEAPGTFNHSLVVGTLAEAAGNAIGANGLLCRAGAYYHDIGKLSKPQYFVENQSGGPNRHDKLSPAMSLLIIVGHVKDGIELAREYGLPWVIIQFIGQHHGTTLVEYFFHAAKERQARENALHSGDSTQVSEAEFRYPGPRPLIRETAILMLADGSESIARTIPEPTPGRIETVVHQLIMKRLMDGQFSQCDLTLRDLGLIEQALTRTLAGVYHGRVAYPKATPAAKPA